MRQFACAATSIDAVSITTSDIAVATSDMAMASSEDEGMVEELAALRLSDWTEPVAATQGVPEEMLRPSQVQPIRQQEFSL